MTVRLLLLDDELESRWARTVVRSLDAHRDFELTTTSTSREFFEQFASIEPDVVIVDWELKGVPPGRADDNSTSGESGLDVVGDLVTGYANVPVVFCTKYKNFKPKEHLDPRVISTMIEKPIRASELTGWVEETLLPSIARVRARFDKASREPLGLALEAGAEPYFARTLDELDEISVTEFRRLRLDAYEAMERQFSGVFLGSDAAWFIVVRQAARLRIAAWSPTMFADPPSPHEVRLVEENFNSPSLVVSRPPRVEMVDVGDDDLGPGEWVSCGYDGSTEDAFPSLSLVLRGHRLDMHFDTGSSHTFVNFESLSRIGAVSAKYRDHAWKLSSMSSRGTRRTYEWTEFSSPANCPRDDGAAPVRFVAQMVYDWQSTPVSVRCKGALCPLTEIDGGDGALCGRRVAGLVGRDFLRKNPDVVVVLDGGERTTRVFEKTRGRRR